MVSLSLDSELVHDDGRWSIVDDGRTLATFPRHRIRVSVSWKAIVFTSETDRRRHDEHTDDIDADEVLQRFARDLAQRGIAAEVPEDPFRDPGFIRLLRATYVRTPTSPS
jgi:hypothetical protein